MRFWAIIMGKTEKRIGHLLCMAGTFLAVASVQFCPVKAYSVSTSTVISIVGALLCWRSRREVNPLEGFFEIRRKLREAGSVEGLASSKEG